MNQVVGLPSNSYKPITNTAWVRTRFCKLQNIVESGIKHNKSISLKMSYPLSHTVDTKRKQKKNTITKEIIFRGLTIMNGKYYLYQNMLSLIQLSICGETTLSTKRGLISQYAPHKIQKTSIKPILICFPIIFTDSISD